MKKQKDNSCDGFSDLWGCGDGCGQADGGGGGYGHAENGHWTKYAGWLTACGDGALGNGHCWAEGLSDGRNNGRGSGSCE